jgi:membrane associated rhomboid family serine protease
MSAKIIFRGLLIATVISMAAEAVTYHFQQNSLPLELREYLRSRSEHVLSHDYSVFSVVTVAYAIFFIMSFVGLYFFAQPARLLFCGFILVGLFMPLAGFGPDVETDWMELWGGCSSIFLGVILCMIFTSPIRDRFTKTHDAAA